MAGLLVGGCGGSVQAKRAGQPAAVMLMATAPNSLDPAVGDNPQALETDWLLYTPLLTYDHVTGVLGTHVIPGLAQTLPGISGGGRVYSLTLRPGLKYSNGQPVRATDFTWAVERAIRLWSGSAQITSRIAGAAAFAQGKAKTISGITADDATGQVTIQLTAPDGTFENVLALPAMAPVPAGTPVTDEQSQPPPGLGPYSLTAVVPGRSFSLIRNPDWGKLGVQGVPPAHLDVNVRITGDVAGNARSVLEGSADVFDWPDQIPAGLLSEIERSASHRYFARTMEGSELIFLNAATTPFSNQLAREAVRAGLDQNTLAQLDGGTLRKGCYVLLPNMFGHPGDACPDGNKAGDGDLSLARALVTRSGMAGSHVTVWSESGSPVRQWMSYYTSLLNEIGFKASLKVVQGDIYHSAATGHASPQTGYEELDQQLPNPADPYRHLTGQANPSTTNQFLGQLADPYLNTSVHALAPVPASTLGAVANYWREVELYVAGKAYVAVIGYPTFPEFVSNRIDFHALVFSPVAGYDLSSLRLK